MSSNYTISLAHVRSVHHSIGPCPVSTSSHPSTSTQHIISCAHVQSLHHVSCLCLVSTLPLYCVQIVHHIVIPCSISTPFLLSMSSQYCPCAVTTSSILPIPCQYTISTDNVHAVYIPTDHVQLLHYLSSPRTVSITYLLSMCSQYTISPVLCQVSTLISPTHIPSEHCIS